MDFIQNISESRIIGNSKNGLSRFNVRDIADILFLYIVAIHIIKHDFYGLPELQKYISSVGNLSNFDNFIPSKNDLYLFLHVLFGMNNDNVLSIMKDDDSNKALLPLLRINMQEMRKFLLMAKNGQTDISFERRFLLSLENGLRIQDSKYKSIRRLASDWSTETESVKRLVMTRLLQIFRSKARRSEILPILEKVSKTNNLEDKRLPPMENEPLGQKTPKTSILANLGAFTAAAAAGYYGTRGFKK